MVQDLTNLFHALAFSIFKLLFLPIDYSSYYKAGLGWLRVTSFLKMVHSLYKSLPASFWVKSDNSFLWNKEEHYKD